MTAWLLSWFPGWLTGSAGSRARHVVNGWTKNNATLRTLRYGRFRRFLLWSADHPIFFTLLVAAFSAAVAYTAAGHLWAENVPNFPKLTLNEKFDIASYTGVPWSVQATLVALVYPIVLSFIALMLQRRAHSSVALRVYVLDSAVVPAGASSIGLLLAMGVQYFATPYIPPSFITEHMASLPVMNGTWFCINVLITGCFLGRTLKFLHEEEERLSYARIAVDTVLRSELTSAVRQYVFVNAPNTDWGIKTGLSYSDEQPKVFMFSGNEGEVSAQRTLKGNFVLHDVHLHILKWAVRSWYTRASLQRQRSDQQAPVIYFPPRVGLETTGRIVLCSIKNGPSLTAFERFLIKAAFFYRPVRQRKLSLSTAKMLEEIGAEVQSAAEQQRFGAAVDGLRNVFRLHKTLLLASVVDSQDANKNAATIGTSPYAWGEASFDTEWLETYREIGHIAVTHLDQDSRLFRNLSAIPSSFAASLPAQPEKLVINAMWVGTHLMHQLGIWWTKKADASLGPGATTFSGSLPAPLSKVYEAALIAFIGNWGHLRINGPSSQMTDAGDAWGILTARALVYAKHIENSAEMFLNAVSRGDEVASRWLLDNFLKWWGNRKFELEYSHLNEFELPHVTLSLAEKPWSEAQCFLWDGGPQVTIEIAGKALNLAIHRYWESIRLYVALVLIHNAGPTPGADCRELRFAASLIKGIAQYSGGRTACRPINNVDSVTTALLELMFGDKTIKRRIDKFADKLHMNNRAPAVSGWIYSWAGTPTELHKLKRAQVALLVAVSVQRGTGIGKNKKLIESWWRDLDTLESVAHYCTDLRREVLAKTFSPSTAAVLALQTHLETKSRVSSARLALAGTMKRLCKVAMHERTITLRALDVNEHELHDLAEAIVVNAFDPQRWSSCPATTVQFVPDLQTELQSLTFEDNKISYVSGEAKEARAGYTDYISENFRQIVLGKSFLKRVSEAGLAPVNDIALRNNHEATVTEQQSFIAAVAERCTSLRMAGIEPIVLVGQSALLSYIQPTHWGPNSWQCELPPDIAIRHGKPSKGELPVALINDTPIYEFDTPNDDCYVVPSSMVKTLEFAGSNPSSALTIKWTQLNDERLQFSVSWKARFR